MRPLFRGIRSNAILLTVCLFVLAASSAAALYMLRPHFFIKEWAERLRSCRSLEDAARYPEQYRIAMIEFANGEWVVGVMEHECCTGTGFNASIFRDSRGKMYLDRTYSFCGGEEFKAMFHPKPASLKEFYGQLKQNQKLRLTELR